MDATSADSQASTSRRKQEEQFILGDDDIDAEDALPPYQEAQEARRVMPEKGEQEKEQMQVGVHHIQATDTLQGIAFAYGLEVGHDGVVCCLVS